MRTVVGPFWVLNPNSNTNWGYFDLNNGVTTYYVYDSNRWKQLHLETEEIWYTYFPQNHAFIAWANTEEGLIKAPMLSSASEQESSSANAIVHYFNSVFKPVFLDKEVRWVPVLMKRASDFGFLIEHFPNSLSSVPLPNVTEPPVIPEPDMTQSRVSSAQFFSSSSVLPTVIEAQQNIHEACNLSLAQQSFITQCIEANGHWPLTATMRRNEKIVLCLQLIEGRLRRSAEAFPIKQYRDPIYLARLMTGSFYPQDASDAGYHTTVGDVWIYINLLLGAAVNKLNYQGEIRYYKPYKGTGTTAKNYLRRMGIQTELQSGLNLLEEFTYQLIINSIAEMVGINLEENQAGRQLLLEDCNQEKLIGITEILQCLLTKPKEAKQIDLMTKIFNAAQGLLSGAALDDNGVMKSVLSRARELLSLIATERLKRDIAACNKYPTELQMIQILADDIKALHDIVPIFESISTLSKEGRGHLIRELKTNARWMFKLSSQDDLVNLFESTPQQEHLNLIRLLARDIYALNNQLDFDVFQSILNERSYRELVNTSTCAWNRSATFLFATEEPKNQTVQKREQIMTQQTRGILNI